MFLTWRCFQGQKVRQALQELPECQEYMVCEVRLDDQVLLDQLEHVAQEDQRVMRQQQVSRDHQDLEVLMAIVDLKGQQVKTTYIITITMIIMIIIIIILPLGV